MTRSDRPDSAQGAVSLEMPESTCLHIQDRTSGPIRVVEIPWISARIGSAGYCEVRLVDLELAAEACRIQRRGRTWHLLPLGPRGSVSLHDQPVQGSCPLPFDTPFRIGAVCFTLKHSRTAEPNWELAPTPAPRPPEPPESPARTDLLAAFRTADEIKEPAARPRPEPQTLEAVVVPLKPAQEPSRERPPAAPPAATPNPWAALEGCRSPAPCRDQASGSGASCRGTTGKRPVPGRSTQGITGSVRSEEAGAGAYGTPPARIV